MAAPDARVPLGPKVDAPLPPYDPLAFGQDPYAYLKQGYGPPTQAEALAYIHSLPRVEGPQPSSKAAVARLRDMIKSAQPGPDGTVTIKIAPDHVSLLQQLFDQLMGGQ
jgi:hypothetical protein